MSNNFQAIIPSDDTFNPLGMHTGASECDVHGWKCQYQATEASSAQRVGCTRNGDVRAEGGGSVATQFFVLQPGLKEYAGAVKSGARSEGMRYLGELASFPSSSLSGVRVPLFRYVVKFLRLEGGWMARFHTGAAALLE